MPVSELPSAYDNRLWTPVDDVTLLGHFMKEEERLHNDDALMPYLLAGEGPILDYGCGAGLVAGGITGADTYAFDTSAVMRKSAEQYIPAERVFARVEDIPKNTFPRVWCCLVLCIVDDPVVKEILLTVREKMTDGGTALFTICNPELCRTPKTRLDYRFPGTLQPEQQGRLPKWKREGNFKAGEPQGYGVFERHRPSQFYTNQLVQTGFTPVQAVQTPHYLMEDGTQIPGDFLCFQSRAI